MPAVSSMVDQSTTIDTWSSLSSPFHVSYNTYVRMTAAVVAVRAEATTTSKGIPKARLGDKPRSIGIGSKTTSKSVATSKMLLEKPSTLHVASGPRVELQLTLTGPQNSRTDPNQRTMNMVVKPSDVSSGQSVFGSRPTNEG